VRARINSLFLDAEAPAWQGARSEHTRRYVSDKQRSQAGCIGGQKWEVILARTLTAAAKAVMLQLFCRIIKTIVRPLSPGPIIKLPEAILKAHLRLPP